MPTITQLEYFYALARSCNMSATAGSLHISQPALSNMISKLEAELQTPLFDRVGRRLYLNENGQILFTSVNTALNVLNGAYAELRQHADASSQTLSIGVESYSLLRRILTGFVKRFPTVKVEQFPIRNSHEIPQLLFSRTADLVLTTPTSFTKCFEEVPLCKQEIVLLAHPDNGLSKKKSISLYEAKDEKYVFPLEKSPFSITVSQLCKNAGFSPHIIARCESDFLDPFFTENRCVSLRLHSGHPRAFPCVEIKITDPDPLRPVSLFYLKKSSLPTAAQQWIAFSKSFCLKLQNESSPRK